MKTKKKTLKKKKKQMQKPKKKKSKKTQKVQLSKPQKTKQEKSQTENTLKKSGQEITLSKTEQTNLRLTESKIKKLLNIDHLEELLHILHILNEKQIRKFIEHYKEKKFTAKDLGIDSTITKANNKQELLQNLNKQLIEQLRTEYEGLKERITAVRKKGIDVYIEDIKLMSVPLKIKMFSATETKEDFYKIKKMLFETNQNLKTKEEILASKQKKLQKSKEKSEKKKTKNHHPSVDAKRSKGK